MTEYPLASQPLKSKDSDGITTQAESCKLIMNLLLTYINVIGFVPQENVDNTLVHYLLLIFVLMK